jgi:stage II sporulation protein AA (anti-sigma F factor antagonist)
MITQLPYEIADGTNVETTEHMDEAAGTGTVTLKGRLDSLEAQGLRDTVQRLITGGCRRMTIDLTEVHFIDSAGLAVLVRTHRQLEAADGSLVLVRPTGEDANRIFELTQFDQIFTMRDTAPRE